MDDELNLENAVVKRTLDGGRESQINRRSPGVGRGLALH
jgi:hypothetical protein